MDEILASIRRIIADDQDPVKGAAAPADLMAAPADLLAAPDAADPVETEHPPRVVLSAQISDENEDVSFQPISEPETDTVRAEPAPLSRLAQVIAASPPAGSPRQSDPPRTLETREPRDDMATLVSNEATASVNHAFNMLSHTVLTQNARTLEDLVTDMLKPMLKTWLDDNLPPLVERLVRAEIERVSRGGR